MMHRALCGVTQLQLLRCAVVWCGVVWCGVLCCAMVQHKNNFPVPMSIRTLSNHQQYVRQMVASKGDIIIFPEALVHGALPWTGDSERRAVLFRYSPAPLAWCVLHVHSQTMHAFVNSHCHQHVRFTQTRFGQRHQRKPSDKIGHPTSVSCLCMTL